MITLDKKPKICKNCGKKYIQRSIRQKFCGNRKEKTGCSYIIHKENTKIYLRKNKDRLSIMNKEWILKNRKEINRKRNERHLKRYRTDINYRIAMNMRNRLRKGLARNTSYTNSLIGCSIQDLKNYIEKQFKKGMNWDNYGSKGWTIDHIIPLSSVDLNNKNELKKVCHYTNLQPLWAYENSKKGAKILE